MIMHVYCVSNFMKFLMWDLNNANFPKIPTFIVPRIKVWYFPSPLIFSENQCRYVLDYEISKIYFKTD